MILQALAKYYDRMIQEEVNDLEPEGYKRTAIPFVIVLKKGGSFAGIDPTQSGEGRTARARLFVVPKVYEGSRTGNIMANLLWDKASYVFGVCEKEVTKRSGKKKEDFLAKLQERREKFLNTIFDYFQNQDVDDGVQAVVNFLKHHQNSIKTNPYWEEIKSNDPNIAFRLEGEETLICNRDAVKEAISNKNKSLESEQGLCLVTGRIEKLTRLENPIKGLRGSGKGESHLVSFNDSAYWSYGKTFGANASISKYISSAYVTAINFMQRENSRQWIKVGDATTVFWAERKHDIEDWFVNIFGEPAKGEPEQDYESLIAMFRSPETGARVELDRATKFYVLGLSPNSARIAIRFWYAGTVGDIADNIWQHFDDLKMVKSPKEWRTITMRTLLRSTALQEKDDNIQPNLAGDFMRAILAGTPYPATLLSSAIRRIKAEREVTYPRASLIKAILVKNARFYETNPKEEVGMSLDTSNTNTGYRLGRLFAVLEKIQEEASPGINATIRDRFYGSASSVPVTVFSHLMKLKNHHIAKLESKGRAVNLEKIIGEIVDDIKDFPGHLSLDDQGRFAVGYYHQRQDLFKKKNATE